MVLLSYLTTGKVSAEITGLEKFPEKDWPNVSAVFQTYHLMIATWVLMLATVLAAFYCWWKKKLYTQKWLLRALVVGVIWPQIGNQVGWVSAEMGRYPWIVYNLLRISDGLSKTVTANQVLSSIILFTTVYIFLFIMFIYLLHQKIVHGPTDETDEHDETASLYPHQKAYAKGLKDEPK